MSAKCQKRTLQPISSRTAPGMQKKGPRDTRALKNAEIDSDQVYGCWLKCLIGARLEGLRGRECDFLG